MDEGKISLNSEATLNVAETKCECPWSIHLLSGSINHLHVVYIDFDQHIQPSQYC